LTATASAVQSAALPKCRRTYPGGEAGPSGVAQYAGLKTIIVVAAMNENKSLRFEHGDVATILNTLSALVLVLDQEGHIIGFNHACEQTTGYMFEEIQGRRVWDFLLMPEEIEAVKGVFGALKSGQFPNRFENFIVSKNGRRRLINWSNNALLNDKGKVEYIIATGIDITERKQAEDDLRRTQERLKLALIASDLALWEFNVQTGEGYVDQHWYEMFDYNHDEIKPNLAAWRKLIHPDDLDRYLEAFLDHLNGQAPFFEASFRLRSKSNDWKWVLDKGKIVSWDKDGRPLRISGTLKDITEDKRIEDKRRQSQKMEAIGVLAGGVAHDFNNILGAIFGYTELCLLDVPSESRTYRNLKHVINAVKRAADLAKQVLAISRQTEQERKPMAIQPVVKEVMRLMRGSLPSTIKIVQDFEVNCGPILADATQIHQVVLNLCTNAYHAMRDQDGVLSVSLKEVEVDSSLAMKHHELTVGSYARLTVEDTGHGMDKDTLERIFEPYFSTKKTGEGTGLGLAIVHGIVTNHDGAITVDSTMGKGTSVNVYFPILTEHYLVQEPEDIEPTFPRIHAKILFVDDEETIKEVGEHILEEIGCEVAAFTDSMAAFKAFQANPAEFDVVITDKTMPNLTGFELAQKMLKIRPDLPIIVVTGFSEAMDEEKAKTIGICEFILKPLSIHVLSEKIIKVLKCRDEKAKQLNLF